MMTIEPSLRSSMPGAAIWIKQGLAKTFKSQLRFVERGADAATDGRG
jgi:hypothetical protein